MDNNIISMEQGDILESEQGLLMSVITEAFNTINDTIVEVAKTRREIETTKEKCRTLVKIDKEHCKVVMKALEVLSDEIKRNSNAAYESQATFRNKAMDLIDCFYLQGVEPPEAVKEMINQLLILSMKIPEKATNIDICDAINSIGRIDMQQRAKLEKL